MRLISTSLENDFTFKRNDVQHESSEATPLERKCKRDVVEMGIIAVQGHGVTPGLIGPPPVKHRKESHIACKHSKLHAQSVISTCAVRDFTNPIISKSPCNEAGSTPTCERF